MFSYLTNFITMMVHRLAPSYDQALNNLGNLYKEQGNFTLAEEYLWKALSVRYKHINGVSLLLSTIQ